MSETYQLIGLDIGVVRASPFPATNRHYGLCSYERLQRKE